MAGAPMMGPGLVGIELLERFVRYSQVMYGAFYPADRVSRRYPGRGLSNEEWAMIYRQLFDGFGEILFPWNDRLLGKR